MNTISNVKSAHLSHHERLEEYYRAFESIDPDLNYFARMVDYGQQGEIEDEEFLMQLATLDENSLKALLNTTGGRLEEIEQAARRVRPSAQLLGPSILQSAASPKFLAQRRLFELEQLEVSWEEQTGALWTFIRPRGRPCFNLHLLDDFDTWQRGIGAAFANRPAALRYLVLGSRMPGVFSLGSDLDYFLAKIRERNRSALVAYGESCVRVLHRNLNALGLPMITIGLAQGDAFGGGFETLLSFNVIIAERTAKFGFPESLFGLFPGMGAYSLLARRNSAAFVEEMMLSGRTYSADEMKAAGLVHIVVEPGQGIDAVRDYIHANKRRHAGARGVFRAGREINPVSLEELDRIVAIWADSCLELSERDLKLMQRLVSAQDRLQGAMLLAE